MTNWNFISAENIELDEALKGRLSPAAYPWPNRMIRRHAVEREVGVLVQTKAQDHSQRPAAVVVSPEMSRRFFGAYSQLHSDLSPISSWTHILSWEQFELMSEPCRSPQLNGYEASWTGLVLAETLILTDLPISRLKLAACLATPTYALARASSLWNKIEASEIISRYDQCQKLLKPTDRSTLKLREAFAPIWNALLIVSRHSPKNIPKDLRILVEALNLIKIAREQKIDEIEYLMKIFDFPYAEFLTKFNDMPPEIRLRMFDTIVERLDDTSQNNDARRNELYFLAGYIATVAAGGAPSLGLAHNHTSRHPQIIAWAYIIGGIGENTTWTSGFDGLGRLVARELTRTFRLDDAPTCDFAFEEASILIDRALQDPLVHLRIKQSRVMSVALLPGVNVAISFVDATENRHQDQQTAEITGRNMMRNQSDPMQFLADALWPYISNRILQNDAKTSNEYQRKNTRNKLNKKDNRGLWDDE